MDATRPGHPSLCLAFPGENKLSLAAKTLSGGAPSRHGTGVLDSMLRCRRHPYLAPPMRQTASIPVAVKCPGGPLLPCPKFFCRHMHAYASLPCRAITLSTCQSTRHPLTLSAGRWRLRARLLHTAPFPAKPKPLTGAPLPPWGMAPPAPPWVRWSPVPGCQW